MKSASKKAFIILSLFPWLLNGQALYLEIEADLDADRKKERLLFYNSEEEETDETRFTKVCVVSENETFCVENEEAWAGQKTLYQKADQEYNQCVGLIKDQGRFFLWLTGAESVCCLNNTTILEWTGTSLEIIFSEEFEAEAIELIHGKKYLTGTYAMAEVYGDMDSDYYFSSFIPTEYHMLSDSMNVDSVLTQQKNIEAQIEAGTRIVEKNMDVYDAVIVHFVHSGVQFLISNTLASTLSEKEDGIMSLIKKN